MAVLSIFLLVGYSIFSVFDVTQGQLRRMELVITTASATKYYDGTPLSKPEWELKSGNLREGDSMFVTMSSSITDFGVVQNEIGVTIIDKDQINVTNNYAITYELGFLTINKRPLSIKTYSAYKVYDGTPLTGNFYEVTSGTIPEDHEMLVSMPTVLTEPGEVTNDIHITILNKDGVDVTKNFYMTYELGTLKMDSRPLFVETESLSKVYDGLELFGGYPILKNEILPNHYITIVKSTSIIEASSKTNETIVQITDEFGNDVSRFYDIQYNFGELRIDKRIIQLRTMSAEKSYDTTPLFAHGFDVLYGNLVLDHYFDIVYKNSITTPGSVDNEIDVKIMDGLGNYVTSNYDIQIDNGKLVIYKFLLMVTTESFQKYYDGITFYSNEPYIEGQLLSGHRIEIIRTTDVVDAGYYENIAEIAIVNEYGYDVTNYYDFIFNYGLISIYQRPIVIQTKNASKAYDGLPLTLHEHELISGSLVDGHMMDIRFLSSITNPDIIPNDVFINIYDMHNIIQNDNYQIEIIRGELEVYRIPLVIETDSFRKSYDGLPIHNGSVNFIGSLLEGHFIQELNRINPIEVGEYTNSVTIKIFDEAGRDVTNTYEFINNFGKLYIDKRVLIVQTDTKSKIYDGIPISSSNFSLTENNLLPEHTVMTTFISEITEPGKINNVILLSIYDTYGNEMTHNYDIEYEYGTLEILKRDIYLKSLDARKPYDGLALTHPHYVEIENNILPNHTLDILMTSSITEPGEKKNEIYAKIYDEFGNDVTRFYELKLNLGTLRVEPIELVIKSASDNKVYDGTPLTNPNWEILSGQILPEHQLVVYVDGSITEVGKINNLAYAIVYDENGQDVSKFYNFEYAFGELTILVNIYSGDNISTDSVPDDDTVYLKLNSSKSGTVYLRDKSYGNYNGKGWEEANPYLGSIGVHPLSFVSQTLLHSNFIEETVSIEYVKDKLPYYLPYYTTNYLNGSNDVHYYGPNQTIHNHTYIPFDYLENTSSLVVPSDVEIAEMVYRTYVYQTYLDLPNMTKNALARIAQQNGLSDESSTLIEDIQEYIQNAATYDKDFGSMPKNVDDIVIYFLEIHKKGICQHFAAAATLMYRYFGIPARYVVGFVANAQKDTWVEVDGNKAHAWVEIYLDGMGWVIVEVTPGNGFGGGIGDEEDGNIKPKISVRPHNVIAPYEIGKTISATEVTINGLDFYLNMGYTYTYTLSGSLSSPGKSYSEVASFTIYDPDMKDVTSEFNIQKNKGLLQLYLHEINLVTSSGTKVYDGSPLYKHEYHIEGTLGYNHQVRYIEFVSEITNVGRMLNRASIIIEDEMGRDVTELYYINTYYGELIVTPRYIVIKSADATKIFDGLPLINNNFEIIEGSIVLGDELQVVITGIQSSIGSSENIIESITIYKNGIEITYNYEIDIELGLLIVRPF